MARTRRPLFRERSIENPVHEHGGGGKPVDGRVRTERKKNRLNYPCVHKYERTRLQRSAHKTGASDDDIINFSSVSLTEDRAAPGEFPPPPQPRVVHSVPARQIRGDDTPEPDARVRPCVLTRLKEPTHTHIHTRAHMSRLERRS